MCAAGGQHATIVISMSTLTYDTDHHDETLGGILVDLSPEKRWEFFDTQARSFLGISGKEFERRWNRGDYAAGWEREEDSLVLTVRMAMPDYSPLRG